MTNEQYNTARQLKAKITELRFTYGALDEEENHLGLPPEMYERHQEEKRTFLGVEIARLEAAFADL